MLHLVNQDHFYQELGQNILFRTRIQVEGGTYFQNQHQYMEQFINKNWDFRTQENTSVGYHKKFIKYLSIIFHRKLAMILWLLIH